MKITALIIAAGPSRRMGEPKQLLAWKNSTLLGHTIEQLKFSKVNEVITVLGAHFDAVEKEIKKYKTPILKNEHWQKGMGTSISCGINHLMEKENRDAVLICLADQPFIDTVYYNKLINSFYEHPSQLIATKYDNRGGVPAIFPNKYFNSLSKLNDDYGAKEILKTEKDIILISGAKNLVDIDTYKDYRQVLELQ